MFGYSSRSSKRGYDRLKASKSDTNVNNSPDLQRNTYKGSLTPEAESAATTTLTIPTATTTLTIPTANTTLTIPTATTNLTMPTGTVPTAMGKGTTPTTDFLVDVTPVTSPSVSDASDYDDDDDDDDDEDSDDDDDEILTCNVCDRVFPTPSLLASHQTRKRHYGCSTCESVFPTPVFLEAHKEETSHWSDDDFYLSHHDDYDDLYDDQDDEQETASLL
ncbi:GATA zinc finger domain-containing protein 17-like [Cherax quadricarinatus]|uniref:GATA zinc finger domain-containing protein 17-like n=1 Tax=Cherax quadricarinatus TaxID=27406 RepID=UPI00387E836C